MNSYSSISIAILSLVLYTSAFCATPVSGDYGGVLLAFDKSSGSISGEFESSAGGEGPGEVTCKFFFYGKIKGETEAEIKLVDPTYLSEEIGGKVKFGETGGKPWLLLKSDKAVGACARYEDFSLQTPSRRDLLNTTAINKMGIVVSSKAKLFNSPSAEKPMRAYLVSGDTVIVLDKKENRTKIRFVSDSGKATEGWLENSVIKP
ncbi:hypothetical protein ACUHMQ_16720 [Chitinimonas sp. PSY-7]|uniref:hypothetical protein n=1 Tax=Chitinimonas sp. PSY-7 TaxID=3459088 RepID=UPI00403FCEB6